MGIGIEIELRSQGVRFEDICSLLGNRFTNISACLRGFVKPIIDGRTYNICVMAKDEHYRHTIEFNIYPMAGTIKNLKETQEFIQHLTTICNSKKSNLLTIFSDCPEFVGLHIHMFMKGALKIRNNKEIFNKMSYFTMAYFQYELWKENMIPDLNPTRKLELFSDMNRGIRNHTIMRHYDRHVLDDALTKIQCRYNIEWHYGVNFGTGTDKVKYAPVIFSALRRNGKRTSIEARYAFNYFAKWNIEVLMRYVKIMEQTDWANVYVKGNLEALFELTCTHIKYNYELLKTDSYWVTAASNNNLCWNYPKEVMFLDKFKPEICNQFEPEIMFNGKLKKPKFITRVDDDILRYSENNRNVPHRLTDWSLLNDTLIPRGSFHTNHILADTIHCLEDLVDITIGDDCEEIYRITNSVGIFGLRRDPLYVIYADTLFMVMEVPNDFPIIIRDNFLCVIGKSQEGVINKYLIYSASVDVLNKEEVQRRIGTDPRAFFSSNGRRGNNIRTSVPAGAIPRLPDFRAFNIRATNESVEPVPTISESLSIRDKAVVDSSWKEIRRYEVQNLHTHIPQREGLFLKGRETLSRLYSGVIDCRVAIPVNNMRHICYLVQNIDSELYNTAFEYKNGYLVEGGGVVRILNPLDFGLVVDNRFHLVMTFSQSAGHPVEYYLIVSSKIEGSYLGETLMRNRIIPQLSIYKRIYLRNRIASSSNQPVRNII